MTVSILISSHCYRLQTVVKVLSVWSKVRFCIRSLDFVGNIEFNSWLFWLERYSFLKKCNGCVLKNFFFWNHENTPWNVPHGTIGKIESDREWQGGVNAAHDILNSPDRFWSCTLTMMRWNGGLAESSSPGTAGNWETGATVESSLKTTAGFCPLPRWSASSDAEMWICRTTTSGVRLWSCGDLDMLCLTVSAPEGTRPVGLEVACTSLDCGWAVGSSGPLPLLVSPLPLLSSRPEPIRSSSSPSWEMSRRSGWGRMVGRGGSGKGRRTSPLTGTDSNKFFWFWSWS